MARVGGKVQGAKKKCQTQGIKLFNDRKQCYFPGYTKLLQKAKEFHPDIYQDEIPLQNCRTPIF